MFSYQLWRYAERYAKTATLMVEAPVFEALSNFARFNPVKRKYEAMNRRDIRRRSIIHNNCNYALLSDGSFGERTPVVVKHRWRADRSAVPAKLIDHTEISSVRSHTGRRLPIAKPVFTCLRI